ncbi:hypothetical protein O1611_g1141 [Lasiodiplodia mahajangana]|uniref:Uncharacterized protein n=1 Tax=Lasiodiplodia mahajangana TaxID=1108764 RepID=A0ACC2JYR3_9PEZI|nr:hypothetical protein O1611_g1141 [Lasiodiplodia mahajangana]
MNSKDAANKVKNSVLGNDPRWIRPKDDEEEGNRIRALRNSLRGRRRQENAAHSAPQNVNAVATGHNNAFASTLEDGSLGGTTIAHSYRSSAEESQHHPNHTSLNRLGTTDTGVFTTAADTVPSSRFSFFGRLSSPRQDRQDTGLTTSTDISITSVLQEKLSFLSLSKRKRIVKVFKRYTFPKNLDAQRASDIRPSLYQGPEFQSPADRINDPFSATHAVPGDFLNAELFTRRHQCASQSPTHEAGLCWCKVADNIFRMQRLWATFQVPGSIFDPNLTTRDLFGNTMFHHLATKEDIQDQFLHLVSQALHNPRLPIRYSNTAGQTFLHVLHRSWFQEGSRLNELFHMLQTSSFNVFATDVYGRSFYHMMRLRGSTQYPGRPTDIYRMNRRDAFGMKPIDTQPSPSSNHAFSHNQTTQGTSTTTSAALGRSIPRINTQTGATEENLHVHTELLKVLVSAVGVDHASSPNPQNEDSQGRNGFHCLAEVNLCLSPGTPNHNSRVYIKEEHRPACQGHNKRKHNDDEKIDLPRTTANNQRLDYIRGLIIAGVDANQYDKQGNTPLMSFVVNSSDATKYEKEESEIVIRALVQEAGAKLESRNRNGETVLHLAARYGKPSALRVLLELGANPHTRNAQGFGILEVIDNLYATTERDDKNNARFEASRAVLTRTSDCAVQNPTLVEEWKIPS